MAKSTPVKKLSFEKAMDQLEKIVAQIETGEIGLEESLEKYAQGIKLITQCRAVLTSAEKKIEQLTAEENPTTKDKKSVS